MSVDAQPFTHTETGGHIVQLLPTKTEYVNLVLNTPPLDVLQWFLDHPSLLDRQREVIEDYRALYIQNTTLLQEMNRRDEQLSEEEEMGRLVLTGKLDLGRHSITEYVGRRLCITDSDSDKAVRNQKNSFTASVQTHMRDTQIEYDQLFSFALGRELLLAEERRRNRQVIVLSDDEDQKEGG